MGNLRLISGDRRSAEEPENEPGTSDRHAASQGPAGEPPGNAAPLGVPDPDRGSDWGDEGDDTTVAPSFLVGDDPLESSPFDANPSDQFLFDEATIVAALSDLEDPGTEAPAEPPAEPPQHRPSTADGISEALRADAEAEAEAARRPSQPPGENRPSQPPGENRPSQPPGGQRPSQPAYAYPYPLAPPLGNQSGAFTPSPVTGSYQLIALPQPGQVTPVPQPIYGSGIDPNALQTASGVTPYPILIAAPAPGAAQQQQQQQPQPQPAETPQRRGSALKTIALMLGVFIMAVGGVGAGWMLFVRKTNSAATGKTATAQPGPAGTHGSAAPASAGRSPAAGRAAPAAGTTSSAPAKPAAAANGAAAAAGKTHAAAPARADVTSLKHPPGAPITSPQLGRVSWLGLSHATSVHKGQKLFKIERALPPGGKAKALAARIAKLKKMAAANPDLYSAFLQRAEQKYKHVHRRIEVHTVRAPRDAQVTPTVSRGARVKRGSPLAHTADPHTWVAKATFANLHPDSKWSCSLVASGGSKRAPCRIESVDQTSSGAAVTARVDADQAKWLHGSKDHLQLQLAAAAPSAN